MYNSNFLKQGTILAKRYKIIKVIKQGGFGIIYLVKDLQDSKKVIVKEQFFIHHSIRNRNGKISNRKIKNSDISFDKLKEDVKREINNLKEIDNRNIVKAYDFFEENNTIYSVMEYIKGSDLEEYLEDNVFNEDEAKDLLQQLINGLKEFHNKNMVHRDIKPSNIMKCSDGIYKIIDFTTSKVYSNRVTNVTGIRSPIYCPPELEKRKARIGNFSDIYSIGIILIRVFSKESSIPNLTDRLMSKNGDDGLQKLIVNLDISKEFRDVIIKMTHLDPQKRFQNLEEIEDILFKKLKGKEMYQEKMSSANPGCIIIMIDQSWSMNEPCGKNGEIKKDLAARVVNNIIYEVVRASSSGKSYKNRCHISVIGYGEKIDLILGDYLIKIAENPLRVERDKKRDNRKTPIWIEPKAGYNTPMDSAFIRATQVAKGWVDKHPNSFPPLVINISDGEPDDMDDAKTEAKKLTDISTNDGKVLLLNVHLSEGDREPIKLPNDSSVFSNDNLAKFLFDISSELPPILISEAKKEGFRNVKEGARGMVYNADAKDLIRLLNFGSSVAK